MTLGAGSAASNSADTSDWHDGWEPLISARPDGFERRLPALFARACPGMMAEMRVQPAADCVNGAGGLHGGFLSAIAERSLSLPLYLHGRVATGGVLVVDFNVSFLAGGTHEYPVVARVELLRETGRMAFLRGTLSQRGAIMTAYSGTVRKLSHLAR